MRNTELYDAIRRHGLTQMELAELINDEIENLTGKRGLVCDRTVRQWLSGQVRWPNTVQRYGLETVFECSAAELGFVSRRTRATPQDHGSTEDSVHRRRFVTAAAGTALTATSAPAVATSHRVGMADVEMLQGKFVTLIASDQRHGGRLSLEAQACAFASEALALQQRGGTSQRVRSALYACAASFLSSAMWAAIDGRRFDAAQQHLDRASSLATMSGDATIQFRIWSHAGTLYRHLRRPTDALAANDVAGGLSITKKDPMFAALGHARQAAIHGFMGNRQAVRRALGYAEEALGRSDPNACRPLWLAAVRDGAELEELAVSAYCALGDYEKAEAHAHRSLALFHPYMRRDRALVTARLAQAQLGQGDIEPAVATAMSIPSDVSICHPRVAQALHGFGAKLHATAPGSGHARSWDQHIHDARRNLP